jgi:hypothetical protein
MQQSQSQVVPSVAQPQSPAPLEIVVLDDLLLGQVSGGWMMGPGTGWSDLAAGPGTGW